MSTTALEHELRTAAERLRASQDVKGRIESDRRELLELLRVLLRLREPLALLLDCQARYAATSGMYDVLAVDVARAVNDTAEPGRGVDGHIEDRSSGRALYELLLRTAGEEGR